MKTATRSESDLGTGTNKTKCSPETAALTDKDLVLLASELAGIKHTAAKEDDETHSCKLCGNTCTCLGDEEECRGCLKCTPFKQSSLKHTARPWNKDNKPKNKEEEKAAKELESEGLEEDVDDMLGKFDSFITAHILPALRPSVALAYLQKERAGEVKELAYQLRLAGTSLPQEINLKGMSLLLDSDVFVETLKDLVWNDCVTAFVHMADNMTRDPKNIPTSIMKDTIDRLLRDKIRGALSTEAEGELGKLLTEQAVRTPKDNVDKEVKKDQEKKTKELPQHSSKQALRKSAGGIDEAQRIFDLIKSEVDSRKGSDIPGMHTDQVGDFLVDECGVSDEVATVLECVIDDQAEKDWEGEDGGVEGEFEEYYRLVDTDLLLPALQKFFSDKKEASTHKKEGFSKISPEPFVKQPEEKVAPPWEATEDDWDEDPLDEAFEQLSPDQQAAMEEKLNRMFASKKAALRAEKESLDVDAELEQIFGEEREEAKKEVDRENDEFDYTGWGNMLDEAFEDQEALDKTNPKAREDLDPEGYPKDLSDYPEDFWDKKGSYSQSEHLLAEQPARQKHAFSDNSLGTQTTENLATGRPRILANHTKLIVASSRAFREAFQKIKAGYHMEQVSVSRVHVGKLEENTGMMVTGTVDWQVILNSPAHRRRASVTLIMPIAAGQPVIEGLQVITAGGARVAFSREGLDKVMNIRRDALIVGKGNTTVERAFVSEM